MAKTKIVQKRSNRKIPKSPYKGRESTIFALWLSMPFAIRELPTQKLKTMGYDIEDEEFMMLVGCKTRTELAKVLGVHRNRFSEWEAMESTQKLVEEFNLQSNVLRFKKDVDYHFTNATIKEADAGRVKLWHMLYRGWQEKSQVSDPAAVEAIQAQTKVLQALANRK